MPGAGTCITKRFIKRVANIEFSDGMVKHYAKKIMGFAYGKTQNAYMAEDLAQEILCALTAAFRRQEQIADPDGFVFTLCCHTWSKFLRGNKRHWNNVDPDALNNLQSGQSVEQEAENALLADRLRTEMAYLQRLHREILLLFYYENKTGAEVAARLNIPQATVRWHIGEIKKKLKEGMEMNENTILEPKRLWCGHDGQANDFDMHGIGKNPLVDSICIACYGKALTMEELSRTLCVAAAYIEPLVQDLLYMDYLRKSGKNKTITNFYIQTARFQFLQSRFYLGQIGPYAQRVCRVFRRHLDEIKALGFVGSDLDGDFLLWALMPLALNNLYYRAMEATLRKNGIVIDVPRRKDGSRHWVSAGYVNETYPPDFTEEEIEFQKKCKAANKTRGADTGEKALQYDSYATRAAGMMWREFGSDDELRALRRVAALVRRNEEPNDYDKVRIAEFARQGYAMMEAGRPKLLIPFFETEEWPAFNTVLYNIQQEIGGGLFNDLIEAFASAMEKEIPPFVSEDERVYLKYSAYPQAAVLYRAADNGLLRYPTDEEAKRLCTVVWCER